jgi:hypothetical protein
MLINQFVKKLWQPVEAMLCYYATVMLFTMKNKYMCRRISVDICDWIGGNVMNARSISIYTGSVPPEGNNHTSSLTLLNIWFVTINFDILDGVQATVFIV